MTDGVTRLVFVVETSEGDDFSTEECALGPGPLRGSSSPFLGL